MPLLGRVTSLLVATLVVAACAPAAPTAPTLQPATPQPAAPAALPATAAPAQGLIQVQLALGFVPSVQSAPYYLAEDRGYYAAEGLQVELKYGTIQNLLNLISSGEVTFAAAAGDALMPQRQQGVNIKYILTFWSKNPIGALGIAGNNQPPIRTPADLKGKSVGVSAPNSSTHFGLKALLRAAKLSDDDVKLVAIGTTEVEAMIQHRIDVAMTFLPNEAAQMKSLGFNVDTVAVGDYLNLVPPGVATGDKTIAEHPEIVQKFVNATLKGYRDALADPNAAFESSLKRMPELSVDKQPLQRDVLTETLDYYKPPQGRPAGATDPDAWITTQDFLRSIGVIDHTVEPTQYYDNTFVQRAPI